jgi:hypothetical protein
MKIIYIISVCPATSSYIHTNSKTSAGGVGFNYIANGMNFVPRHDLEISMEGVESSMFEIIRKRQKNILGCIYQHPSTLTELNGKGYEVFLLGDI